MHSSSRGRNDRSRRPRCRVLFDFRAEPKDAELPVSRGEVLVVVKEFPAPHDGWLVAANHQGNKGYVPKAFVKILPPKAPHSPSYHSSSSSSASPQSKLAPPGGSLNRFPKPLPPAGYGSSGDLRTSPNPSSNSSKFLQSSTSAGKKDSSIRPSGIVKDMPKCAACGKPPSTSDRLQLLDREWHRTCCKCLLCQAPIARSSLSARIDAGKLVCGSCPASSRSPPASPAREFRSGHPPSHPPLPHPQLGAVKASPFSSTVGSIPQAHVPPVSFPPSKVSALAQSWEAAAGPPSPSRVLTRTVSAAAGPLVVPNKPVPRPPNVRVATTFTSSSRGGGHLPPPSRHP